MYTTRIRKNGIIGAIGDSEGYKEYLNREIEANEKILKNSKAYGLTKIDEDSIRVTLQRYKEKINEVK